MGEPAGTMPTRWQRTWRRLGVMGLHWGLRRAQLVPRLLRQRRRVHPLYAGGAAAAALTLLAILYLGYDLARGALSPCEAVYQQSSVGLKTRISFLKTEGELQIGREQLTELDERAQLAALNLKTCCTVLDAGRLDPEQFLQCKGQARAYEAQLADIADLVRKAVHEGITTASIAAGAAPPSAPPQLKEKIDGEIATAKEISRAFNEEVVAVRKAQALETLRATPPRHVTITAQESEPNDEALATNAIALDRWITGSVGAARDADYFAFTTPEVHRDWIRIELKNRSATLEPRLELFDAEKASLGEMHKTTPGADLTYAFVASPATSYAVRVSNYYGGTTGVYLLRVTAAKAYDAHEPNDDVLSARKIALGRPLAAGIMDRADVDYFAVTSGDEGMLRVALQNRSTTLQPEIAAYNAAKALIGSAHNTTAGGDAAYAFKVAPRATYYVRVRDYYSGAAGDYTLTVTAAPPGDG